MCAVTRAHHAAGIYVVGPQILERREAYGFLLRGLRLGPGQPARAALYHRRRALNFLVGYQDAAVAQEAIHGAGIRSLG